MVDFAKLNNPEMRAKMKERIEREEAAQAEVRSASERALKFAVAHKDRLPFKDQRFIESVSSQMRGFRSASFAQLTWLASIEDRLVKALGFISITSGMRGHFAVHMRASEDFCEPQQTGIGSYRDAKAALPEAQEWAEAEDLYVMHTSEGSVTLLGERLQQLKLAQLPVAPASTNPATDQSALLAPVVSNSSDDGSKRVAPIAIAAARARMRRAA